MKLRVTSKRQVTFPKKVMEQLKLHAGDTLEVHETPGGILLKPQRFNSGHYAPLRDKISGVHTSPDMEEVRRAALKHDLRT